MEELEAKRARRRKREKEKRALQGAEADKEEEDKEPTWMDRVTDWCVVRAGGKIRGVSLVPSDDGAKGIQVRPSLSVLDTALTYTITAPPLAVQ